MAERAAMFFVGSADAEEIERRGYLNDMVPMSLHLELPSWIPTVPGNIDFSSAESRMRFVIDLARRNVREQTGGPFAAAVFSSSHELIAVGVNVVIPQHAAIAHAEIMAIALAGRARGNHNLEG